MCKSCLQSLWLNLTFKDFDDFTQLRLSPDGKPVGNAIDRGGLTAEMAEAFWKRCADLGFIDFANIIYCSLRLLQEHSEVLDAIASRFAFILVDEFQDTTDLQVEILAFLRRKSGHDSYSSAIPFNPSIDLRVPALIWLTSLPRKLMLVPIFCFRGIFDRVKAYYSQRQLLFVRNFSSHGSLRRGEKVHRSSLVAARDLSVCGHNGLFLACACGTWNSGRRSGDF